MARVWNPDKWLWEPQIFIQLHHNDVERFVAITFGDFPNFDYVNDHYCFFVNSYHGLITTFKSRRFKTIEVHMKDGTVKTFNNPNIEE